MEPSRHTVPEAEQSINDHVDGEVEDRRLHGLAIGISGGLMLLAGIGWMLTLQSNVSRPPSGPLPLVRGTDTVTSVEDLTDSGRNSLAQARRVVEEHASMRIQAQGARDLVAAWAHRTGATVGEARVKTRQGESTCSTTISHGTDRDHAMIGQASDPIAACRALIASMEARYPDLVDTVPNQPSAHN